MHKKTIQHFSVSRSLNGAAFFLAVLISISACTKKSEFQDLSAGDVDISAAQKSTYTNKSEYSFAIDLNVAGHADDPQVSVAVYDSKDCSGDFNEQVQTSEDNIHVTGLQDGHTYSFRVLLRFESGAYQSACTAWVGIDQQPPNPVLPVVPPTNMYTTEAKVTAQWAPSNDNGISGLAEKPYLIKLFSQAGCAGTVLKTVQTDSLLEEFAGMSNGNFYSYQVLAVDRAGNQGAISCSPSTEIDMYAPGLALTNPGSDAGFTNSSTVQVSITNDSWAGYWCITTDASFVPTSPAGACPGGQGAANGWSTTKPTSYDLGAGDGLKQPYLWLLNTSGQVKTDKDPLAPVTLDQTAPSVFNVTGITGGTDTILNAYLSDFVDPVVNFSVSTDANLKEYAVQILNADTTVRCQGTAGPGATQFEVQGCNLVAAGHYIARVTAKDYAGNSRTATDYPFDTDLVPPGNFNILGVRGLADNTADTWTSSAPIVDWSASTDAIKYHVDIKDPLTNLTMCGGEQHVAAPTLTFDFTTVTCSPFISGSNYQVFLRSEDDAGLVTTASNQPFVFRVDLDAPLITVNSTPLALSTNTSPSYDFTVADPLSGVKTVECSFNSGAYVPCASPQNFGPLTDGVYTFAIRATDNVGNVRNYAHSFEVDTSGPTTTLTLGPQPFENSATASVGFYAVDSGTSGVASFECNLDGGGWNACVSTYTMSSLAEGAHTLLVHAIDHLGNIGADVSKSWSVDVSGPVITMNSSPVPSTDLATATFDFTWTDNLSGVSGAECRFNGGSWTSCTSPKSYYGLTPGSYTVDLRATDNVGNTTAQSYPFTVTVQVAAPTSFNFTDLINLDAPTVVQSNIIPVTGITGNIATSITGNDGMYRICADSGCSTVIRSWSNTSSTIQNGQYLQLKQTSSLVWGGSISATMTAGTYSTTWTVTNIPEYVYTFASNATQINISNLFTGAQWASNAPKRVVIPSGISVGSLNPGVPALRTGTGRGGTLTIQNAGNILGAGGLANSGMGGTAFLADQAVTMQNAGNIWGGGGGGGVGGAGGNGSYTSTSSYSEGPAYDGYSYVYQVASGDVSGTYPIWGGQYAPGGCSYWAGSFVSETIDQGGGGPNGNPSHYDVYDNYTIGRTCSTTVTNYTNGGAGGAGGRGQGYDGANAGGAGGGAPGTNAGWGGTGGTGGTYGNWGGTGATGGAGNNGGGAGGAGGGAPGYGIQNSGLVSLTNSGSILGQ